MSGKNRVNVYLDNPTIRALNGRAKRAGMPLSRYLAAVAKEEKVESQVHPKIINALSVLNSRLDCIARDVPVEHKEKFQTARRMSGSILSEVLQESEEPRDLLDGQEPP